MNTRATSFWLFLIGLFSETQIRFVGSIGISELFIYVLAPFVFIRDYNKLKRDKFMIILLLAMSAMIGCIISCWHNRTPLPAALRGFATAYSVFAIPVVLHSLLRNNIMGFRWMLLGIAISGVITIFGFYNAAELYKTAGLAADTTSDIVGGEIFWLSHFGAWPVLPVQGWYLATPMPYAIIAPIIVTAYTVMVSSSGRSAILTALLSSAFIFIGGKSRKRLAKIQRNMVFVLGIAIILLWALASMYKFAGRAGLLNEKAQQKYDHQIKMAVSEKGFDPLRMIMAGRIEFFVGLYECIKSPIVGYGPWALDTEGIYEDFLSKYGAPEDYDRYVREQEYLSKVYQTHRYGFISGHSQILQFWLSYGILGLPYWLYVVYLVCQFFRRYLSFLPQFYGFFVVFAISFMWDIFFSPFSKRMGYGLFITVLLLVRAAAMGQIFFPRQLEIEAMAHDK